MGVILYLDTILVPLSLFITIGYHAYLWHNFKHKPSLTTIGINILKRKLWLQEIQQGDDKMGMLAVQSLRNKLMDTILSASITILLTLSLAALTNNSFHANNLFNSRGIFGAQSGIILILKYGSASIFLGVSFLCSSMALGNLIDANFLINAMRGEFASPAPEYTQNILDRGFMLAMVGNRMLCITFPLLLWLLGPVAVALSSMALIGGLYEFDFVGSIAKIRKN